MFDKKEAFENIGPTTASWPREIYELIELPPIYQPYVRGWLSRGMPITNILFVPMLDKRSQQHSEYTVAWFGDEIMLLTPTPQGTVQSVVVAGKDIIYADYQTFLLNCRLTVYFYEYSSRKQITLHYNSVMERAFVPILNIAMHQPSDYQKKILDHPNPFCAALRNKSALMFNYSKLAYRLDPEMLDYFWDMQPIQRTTDKTEYFVAVMSAGSVIIDACDHDNISATYLPWAAVKDVRMVSDRFYRIQCELRPGRILTIPVQKNRQDDAKRFVENWRAALRKND